MLLDSIQDTVVKPEGEIAHETIKHCGELIRDKLDIQKGYFPEKFRGIFGTVISFQNENSIRCVIKLDDFIKKGYDSRSIGISTTSNYVLNAPYGGIFREWKDEIDACWIPLRFVDVENECIVQACSYGKYPAYVAFSRRWSEVQTDVGLPWKSNTGIAFSMKSLMNITKSMGFKWMWVDTLCIDQNNVAEKEEQIPYMGLVYSNAAVTVALLEDTIIDKASCMAIDKNNAYGSKLDEHVNKSNDWLHDTDLILSVNETIEQVSKAVWFKRVWTLQELFKSSVLMYITRNGVVLANDTFKVLCYNENDLILSINKYKPGLANLPHFNFLWQWREMLTPAYMSSILSWTDVRKASIKNDRLFGMLGMIDIDYKPSYDKNFYININEFLVATLKNGDASVLFGVGCDIMDKCFSEIDAEHFPSQFYKLSVSDSSNKVVGVTENSVTLRDIYCMNCRLLTTIILTNFDDTFNGKNNNITAEVFLSSLSGNYNKVIIETAIDTYLKKPLRNSINKSQMAEALEVRDYIRHANDMLSTLAIAVVQMDNGVIVSSFVKELDAARQNMTVAYFDSVLGNCVPGLLLKYNNVLDSFNKTGVILNMQCNKTYYKQITIFTL